MPALADVLPHLVRLLGFKELQALACCQRLALVSNALVEQRFQFGGSNLLRLLAIVKASNLLCHDCFKRPVSHVADSADRPRRQCTRCQKYLCRECHRQCNASEACLAFTPRHCKPLCDQCARIACSVVECKICNCHVLHRCVCTALICSAHQRQCALCDSACCDKCATTYVVPILASTHALCPGCAAKHRRALDHCAQLEDHCAQLE